MKPDHVACNLHLARIALDNLYLVDEAIERCQKINELTMNKNKKSFILYGCALSFKAKMQKQHSAQINYYDQAIESFKK
jgi:hypothetical protein